MGRGGTCTYLVGFEPTGDYILGGTHLRVAHDLPKDLIPHYPTFPDLSVMLTQVHNQGFQAG